MKEEALKLADDMEGRANIRRQATSRKSVQEGANDRLSDQLEQASAMIRRLVEELDEKNYRILELTKRYKALTWNDKQGSSIWDSTRKVYENCQCDSCKNKTTPQINPLERTDVYGLAIESGFMLSTQYGQAEHKLMPVTDGDTLMVLVKAIEERHGIK